MPCNQYIQKAENISSSIITCLFTTHGDIFFLTKSVFAVTGQKNHHMCWNTNFKIEMNSFDLHSFQSKLEHPLSQKILDAIAKFSKTKFGALHPVSMQGITHKEGRYTGYDTGNDQRPWSNWLNEVTLQMTCTPYGKQRMVISETNTGNRKITIAVFFVSFQNVLCWWGFTKSTPKKTSTIQHTTSIHQRRDWQSTKGLPLNKRLPVASQATPQQEVN